MKIVRLAIFDEGHHIQEDDDRRAKLLRELVRELPGFVAGYHLIEESTGRRMSFTMWESDAAMKDAEAAVNTRPVSDQRGISPTGVERWVVEGTF